MIKIIKNNVYKNDIKIGKILMVATDMSKTKYYYTYQPSNDVNNYTSISNSDNYDSFCRWLSVCEFGLLGEIINK